MDLRSKLLKNSFLLYWKIVFVKKSLSFLYIVLSSNKIFFGITVGDKKNDTPFGTFLEVVITLWVFEIELKMLYHCKAKILNFFMVCFVFWYFHFLLRYWCVYENRTLFSHKEYYTPILQISNFFFENFNKN